MAYDVLYIDHGNTEAQINYLKLKEQVPHVLKHKTHVKTNPYWQVSSHADTTNFNFEWLPDTHLEQYEQYGKNKYGMVDDAISMKFHNSSDIHINDVLKIDRIKQHEIFYIDTGSHKNYLEDLQNNHNVKSTRFFDSWQKVAQRCYNKIESDYCWIVPSDVDATTIDFSWYPNYWETNYLHIFKSKWQQNSGVMFVHKDWGNDFTQFKYRDDFVVKGDVNAYDKFFLDFFDNNSKISEHSFNVQTQKIRFFDNHLDTIKRLINKATTKYFWVLSGNCDYTEFDFKWGPDEKTYDHLHTFASNKQEYGDTFFIDKHSFAIKSQTLKNFKHYETINFNTQQKVTRLPYQKFDIDHFDFAKTIKQQYQNAESKYFWITNSKATMIDFDYDYAPDYWSPATVYTFAPDNDVMLVPKDAGPWINEQVYDYPHIKKLDTIATKPFVFDVVYVSNGEPDEEKHWNIIKQKAPRAKWVQGVKGRTKAYQAMAKASSTDWFYACFAKSEIVDEFDFTWQPDRLKSPCHYIFYGKQAINGLEYGHGGVIMYEKHLTLATNNPGIDFTLSAKHDVVPLLSTMVYAGETEYMAWKTAFRECIKLHQDVVTKNDVDAKYRLKIWRSVGETKNGVWSIMGANDGVEFYNAVKGDATQLQNSYEWEWLNEYFIKKYTSIEQPVIIEV